MLVGNIQYGNIEYGTWKDGSSIYKDNKGYYVGAIDNRNGKEYKKYIKNWRPSQNARLLYLDEAKQKWTLKKPQNKNTKPHHSKTLNKYANRPSPSYPANDYCGKKLSGNDGKMYLSKPNKNGVCSWKKEKGKGK